MNTEEQLRPSDELSTESEPADDSSVPLESDDPLEGRADLQNELLKLYQKVSMEDRYPRLIEVKDVKQAENYWANRQYEWWSQSDQCWKPITTPTGGVTQNGLTDEDMPRFQFVTNIYQATGLTIIGAIAGAPPRIRFFPEDPDEETDLETAAMRTKEAKLIERWNPVQLMLQDEAYHAYTGGFICWRTEYISDRVFGSDEISSLNESSEPSDSLITCPNCGWAAPAAEAVPPVPCPNCGTPLTDDDITEEEGIPVPEDGETQEVPRGRQAIEILGALNCKRPQHVNKQSEFHYFAIEKEIHYSRVRAKHPDKAEQIKPGLNFGAEDAFERNARLSVAENTKSPTQTAGAMANLITYAWVWFRNDTFWMIDDKETREELIDLFPNGVRVEFAGTTYCTSEAESMDDVIVTKHALPGRGQHRPALGTSMISVQDRFNTFTNIETETYEYGIPITYRASDTFDSEADNEQRAAPGLECEVFIQPGQDIRQKIMQVRADSVSPDMAKHTMDLMGPVTQYLSGAYPALTGATGEGQQPNTLGQQSMQRDQAMGRMGVPYVNLKQAHADIMTLACRDFENKRRKFYPDGGGQIKLPVFGASGDFESELVDITAIEGEAQAHPEGDENFPELWNQQRAIFTQVMDSPFGVKLMQDMGNAELATRLLGIPDLKIPGRDAWQKQLKEIAEMTKIPEGEDLLVAPMVEVDSDDFHDVESMCCKWWMNNELGQKMKRTNPQGFMLVKQHKAQHDAMIPKPAPPEKPLAESLSIAFKDMPPEAQAQALQKALGITVTPNDFLMQAALEHMKKQPKVIPAGPPHQQTGIPPAAGAQ